MADTIQITGFVVGINESSLLKDSIESLSFCDEVIYVDLESHDESIEIANKLGAKCLSHPPVPYAEFVQSKILPTISSQWVILLDPDERIDKQLANQIISTINELPKNSNVGAISVPTCFYFKGKPLSGTPWGYNNSKTIVFKISAIEFSNKVHRGRAINPNYIEISLPKLGQNTIHHFWMQSWKQLISKHRVYLKHEGRSQNKINVSWKEIFLKPFREFYISLIREKGYREGGTGIALSFFWAWYQTAALLAVKSHSKRMQKKAFPNE